MATHGQFGHQGRVQDDSGQDVQVPLLLHRRLRKLLLRRDVLPQLHMEVSEVFKFIITHIPSFEIACFIACQIMPGMGKTVEL